MRIAFASGKGGAGKTSVTAALHSVWRRRHILVDADVEAPNLHLFVHPVLQTSRSITIDIPTEVLPDCTLCGKCRELCQYGAIARFGSRIMLFPDMCHGCGGCFLVCQDKALRAGTRSLGIIETGSLPDGTVFLRGTTRIGEVMTPPLLRALLHELTHEELKAFPEEDQKTGPDGPDVLIDCPPGVSCPCVTVARKADAMVLVIDPTPFGAADARTACEAFQGLGIPLACVINRTDQEGNAATEDAIRTFCRERHLPVLGEVPFSREAAQKTAEGEILTDVSPRYHDCLEQIAERMQETFSMRTSGGRI